LDKNDDEDDDTPGASGKPEKKQQKQQHSPSLESIAARELCMTKFLRKPGG
jgi:hypothetical protein